MGQITIYLDSVTESKLRKAAKSSRLSVSKWISAIIKDKIETEWSQDVIDLAGAWQNDFPELEEIRSSQARDVEREGL